MKKRKQWLDAERNELVCTRERLEACFDLLLERTLADGSVEPQEASDLGEVLDGMEEHIRRVRQWLDRQPARPARLVHFFAHLPAPVICLPAR